MLKTKVMSSCTILLFLVGLPTSSTNINTHLGRSSYLHAEYLPLQCLLPISSFASGAGILSGTKVCSLYQVTLPIPVLPNLLEKGQVREMASGSPRPQAEQAAKEIMFFLSEARYTNIQLAGSAAFRKDHINLPDMLGRAAWV